jgi:hypothetical protein
MVGLLLCAGAGTGVLVLGGLSVAWWTAHEWTRGSGGQESGI